MKEDIINKYNNLLININTNDVNKINYGFVDNNCDSILLSILIHCIENIDIFNDSQLSNIDEFLNKNDLWKIKKI